MIYFLIYYVHSRQKIGYFFVVFTMYIVKSMCYTMYIVKVIQFKYIKFMLKKEGERI